MALPKLISKKDQLQVVQQFQGVNKGLHISEGEFSDMKNMSNDYFPVLGTRKKRGIINTLTKPMGICGGDTLIYVDDNKLYIDNSLVLQLDETNKERQLVRMGAYLCIFPDGLVYNVISHESQSIENTTVTSTTVTMRMCKLDGTEFTNVNTHIGDTEPADKTTQPYWLDTSSEPVILKMWSDTYSMWTSVATTYVKIASTGIGEGFKEYDSVKVSGITVKGYNDYDFNDTLIVYAADTDYIIVAGLIDLYHTQTEPVTVKRELPIMDYVCELDNRLWGCRYGLNNDGEFVNEVYGSKLGDPTNWYSFPGLNGDSYIASCGSQGEFTGIASYAGYVFFFKEDGFHKLYGNRPSNFQMIWRPCRGVAKGASKSLAVVDEVLFFKARDAVVAYDGSENTVSLNLGIEPYFEGVGVAYRNKYYLSMRDADYHYKLYVYDITKGTWCVEDNLKANYAAYANNATYIIDNDGKLFCINNEAIFTVLFPHQIVKQENIIVVDGIEYDSFYNFPSENLYPGPIIEGEMEDTLEWSFTTGDLGLDNPYNKYVKRINLRMQQDVNSKVKIEVEYDSSGEWEYVTEHYTAKKKSYEIPIAVRRADHVRLRISGWGEFRLYSLTKAVEGGSGEEEG